MKYVDEYRDPQRLQARLRDLQSRCSRRWNIMDVCGGQTHNLLRHGLEAALEDQIELIHGPGCPVCVTPAEVIDDAIQLAIQHKVILATFGDMMRVPGRTGSLLQARATGGDIRSVYCPNDAVKLASRSPGREVVFLAVGFETTIPATALAVLQAEQQSLANFSVLAHHVRVEPAMRALLTNPDCRISSFLAAGHVCTITGVEELRPLVTDFGVPVVVTGFEPWDLVEGLIGCIDQLESGRAELENRYSRCVQPQGNRTALQFIHRVFAVCDQVWRGFGMLPHGGYGVRDDFARFDARQRFSLPTLGSSSLTISDQHCAAVLSGQMRPTSCPLFGKSCTPETPQGAPMVSSEGACAAYYRYARGPELAHD